MTEKIGPVLSPVDYDAWNKGYVPPSEHVLIDALAYRGARIVSSCHTGSKGYWLVVQGDMTQAKRRELVKHVLELSVMLDPDELADKPSVAGPIAFDGPATERDAKLREPGAEVGD